MWPLLNAFGQTLIGRCDFKQPAFERRVGLCVRLVSQVFGAFTPVLRITSGLGEPPPSSQVRLLLCLGIGITSVWEGPSR